jgi:hypothetical protein
MPSAMAPAALRKYPKWAVLFKNLRRLRQTQHLPAMSTMALVGATGNRLSTHNPGI